MLIQKFSHSIFSNYSSSIVNPKLIKIRDNIFIALFELMKLVPAKYTIMKGISEHKINPRIPIIETSSGTYALGLGIVCAELGIPFFIISDPVIDQTLINRLKQLGGDVQIISGTQNSFLDVQTCRLEVLQEHLIKNPQLFWTRQYDNPDNRVAYKDFANFLLENIKSNFTLVGAVGSGGSTSGTIEVLRKHNQKIRLVGVDTFGSILFGLKKGERKLRGLGNSVMPQNLVHEYFDQVHWITQDIAVAATRDLHSTYSLFCGPTTGAVYNVGRWIAKDENKVVVLISPDTGHRYIDTVYNDEWIKKHNINLSEYSSPKHIDNLSNAHQPWSYLNWDRRKYHEVVNNFKLS